MLRKSSSGAGSKVLPRHLSKPHTGSLSSGSAKSWNISKNLSSLSSMGLTSHLAGAPGMDPEYVMQLVSDVRWFADVLLNLKEVFNHQGELKFRSVGGQSSGEIFLLIEVLGLEVLGRKKSREKSHWCCFHFVNKFNKARIKVSWQTESSMGSSPDFFFCHSVTKWCVRPSFFLLHLIQSIKTLLLLLLQGHTHCPLGCAEVQLQAWQWE